FFFKAMVSIDRLTPAHVAAYGRRLCEPVESSPPKGSGLGKVFLFQPADIAAERSRRLQLHVTPAEVTSIKLEELAQQIRRRPAIKQDMMMAPDEVVPFFAKPNERHAHQRRLR